MSEKKAPGRSVIPEPGRLVSRESGGSVSPESGGSVGPKSTPAVDENRESTTRETGLGGELGLYAATAAIFLAVGPLVMLLVMMFGPMVGDIALTIPIAVQTVAATLYVVLPRRKFWRPRGIGDAAALTILVNIWPIILVISSGDVLQYLVTGSPVFFLLLLFLMGVVFAGLVARSRGWRHED